MNTQRKLLVGATLAVFFVGVQMCFYPLQSAGCQDSVSSALHSASNDISLRAQLGIVYAKNDLRGEARLEFEKLMGQPNGQPAALNNLGNLEFFENHFEVALESYQKASVADPEDAGILLNTGVVLYFLGDIDESQEVFDRGVEMLGGVEEALYLLGYHDLDFSRRGESSRVAAEEIRRMLYEAGSRLTQGAGDSREVEARKLTARRTGPRGAAVIAEQNLYWRDH